MYDPFDTTDAVIRDLPHVKITRHAPVNGKPCVFKKYFKPTGLSDFDYWNKRDIEFLLDFQQKHLQYVAQISEIERDEKGVLTMIGTFNAGVSVGDWLRIKPVFANSQTLEHPFHHVGLFLMLLRSCLTALKEIHQHGIIHCDFSASDICIPYYYTNINGNNYIKLDFSKIKLIDFSFSIASDKPLNRALPITPSLPYQSSLLKEALKLDRINVHINNINYRKHTSFLRHSFIERWFPIKSNLEVQKLDWRVDLFGLGYMARKILDKGLYLPNHIADYQTMRCIHNLVNKLISYDDDKNIYNKLPHDYFLLEIEKILNGMSLDDYLLFLVDSIANQSARYTIPVTPIAPTPIIEIIKKDPKAKARYSYEMGRTGLIKVREAKVLLVGQGKSGKTTLRKKLENPNADMPAPGDTTRGIEITRLDEKMPQTGEPLRINVWDFGGQDIQHYAHQFFLTGNSLYALVTNERIQDSVHLPYWLNIIEMLGKKSPVLLIQNKDGGHCQALRDEAAIRARFGNVHNRVFQTDLSQAVSELEFADLRREIVHQASLLPHVERDYLASFVELRGKLEAEADREIHYLNWEDYLALMPELSKDLLRDYANALTFLGVCQYFPNDAMLSGFVFLRPKWIIDALFALLLHSSLETKRGHFTEMDTFNIWQGSEYQGMHVLLVRMMEEFELCYRVEGGNHSYILPQRLPSESKTYGWNEPGDTPVQYRYKFMPKGILTRLICRLHERIETDPERGQRVWCDAVIFTLPDGKGRVFAREVYSENTIELLASGDKRAEMLNEVIRKMDDINRDAKYDNLQFEKLVPCPCEVCQNGEKKHFFDFQLLVDLLEEGEAEERCHVSRRKQNISEVLQFAGVEYRLQQGFEVGGEGAPRTAFPRGSVGTRSALRIFISYSHAQRDYFPIFKADFIQYTRIQGLEVEIFGDDAIPIGTAWDEFLQTKVAECDAMILLVSQEFMNSNYIQANEFGAALERLKAGRSLLIAPVYFAPCQFDSDEALSRLQFFKPHGENFGEVKKGDKFSYIDLVEFSKDRQPIPNSNRQHYMLALMEKLRPELIKLGKVIHANH